MFTTGVFHVSYGGDTEFLHFTATTVVNFSMKAHHTAITNTMIGNTTPPASTEDITTVNTAAVMMDMKLSTTIRISSITNTIPLVMK